MSRGHVAVRAVSPRPLFKRRANQEEVSISRASDEKEKERAGGEGEHRH